MASAGDSRRFGHPSRAQELVPSTTTDVRYLAGTNPNQLISYVSKKMDKARERVLYLIA